MTNKKTAVVLFQLGGPDSLETIEPFLFNLFMDPDIFNFPGAFLVRKPLAYLISKQRSMKSMDYYRLIGGKSPILELTQQQAYALELMLRSQDIDARVIIAMRYWNPSIEAAVKKIKADEFDQVILLPLYPQFSQATTLSCIHEWKHQIKNRGCIIPVKLVCCYPRHPLFIEAFVERIKSALECFQNTASTDIDLIFSAHGVPLSFIKHGDPYQLQVEETVRCIVEYGNWDSPHTICYQSKVGPMKWLGPSLKETVEYLGNKGHKNLLIIPVAFVADHLETLHEINIETRKYALAHGVKQFEMTPALNNHPKFIQCLAELVKTQLESESQPNTCETLWDKNRNRVRPKKCQRIN